MSSPERCPTCICPKMRRDQMPHPPPSNTGDASVFVKIGTSPDCLFCNPRPIHGTQEAGEEKAECNCDAGERPWRDCELHEEE